MKVHFLGNACITTFFVVKVPQNLKSDSSYKWWFEQISLQLSPEAAYTSGKAWYRSSIIANINLNPLSLWLLSSAPVASHSYCIVVITAEPCSLLEIRKSCHHFGTSYPSRTQLKMGACHSQKTSKPLILFHYSQMSSFLLIFEPDNMAGGMPKRNNIIMVGLSQSGFTPNADGEFNSTQSKWLWYDVV